MNTHSFLAAALIAALPIGAIAQQPVSRVEPQLIDRGPHHRTWEYLTTQLDEMGNEKTEAASFVELRTGVSYLDPQSGEWRDSMEAFEITPEGYAVAERGQHKVIISPVLNDAEGAVEIFTPDGVRLRSTILGLVIYDRLTGNSLLIAEVKPEARGEMLTQNSIIFRSCFDELDASVVLTYELGAFHQDVVLHEALDLQAVADLGFFPETTQLEIWTEFFEGTPAEVRTHVIKGEENPEIRELMADPDIIEEELDFGIMEMPMGRAFLEKDASNIEKQVAVPKRFLTVENRDFLVESMSLEALEPLMAELPKAQQFIVNKKEKGQLPAVLAQRSPPSPKLITKPVDATLLALSSSSDPREDGLILDYTIVNTGQTNFVFKGDTTYYVSGTVWLYQTTTIEGGAVIKYANTNSPNIRISGTVDCQTSPYRPAFFTGRDDASVGEVIPPTFTMSGTYAQYPLLIQNPTASITLEHLKVRNALYGIIITGGTNHAIRHCQFVDVGIPIYMGNTSLALQNVLINRASSRAIYGGGSTIIGEHLTIHEANMPFYLGTLYLTNSLLVGITNWSTSFSGAYNATNSSSAVFTSFAGGKHYLTDNTYRNAGTTAINTDLLATLKQTTTHFPLSLSSISTATTLSPQALRDTDIPDLGAHYWPIDSVASNTTVSASLVLTNGVALGIAGTQSLSLQSGGNIYSEGRPDLLNRIAHLQNVQEQAISSGDGTFMDLINGNHPVIRFKFTDLSLSQGTWGPVVPTDQSASLTDISFKDSWLRGVIFSMFPVTASPVTESFHNNLIERSYITLAKDAFYTGSTPITAVLYNNLLIDSLLGVYYDSGGSNPYWYVRDNVLINTGQTLGGNYAANRVVCSNNGFATGTSNSLGGTGNQTGLTPAFDEGPLGRYYYAAAWTNLVNAGSRTASAAGLYHHTTQTDQSKEAGTTVDIGFHYVAADVFGNPKDTDSDGLPDYFEDGDGDGQQDSGETSAGNAFDVLSVKITKPSAQSIP